MKNRSFLPSLLSLAFVLLALCGAFVGAGAADAADADGAAKAGEVRVEVTKPGTGPFLVKGNTYATFLALYYVNDQGEKTFSGFTTYVSERVASIYHGICTVDRCAASTYYLLSSL